VYERDKEHIMKTMRVGLVCAMAALTLAAGAARAQVWAEVPDATQFPPGQITAGFGPLTDITGTLAGGLDVDMYCIEIFAPTAFAAWTDPTYAPGVLGPAFTTFDSQLWLFDASGAAIMHSDDTTSLASGMGFTQPNPIVGPPPPFFMPGIYMLAISQFDIDPLDAGGSEIWADAPFGGWSGPDGAGLPFFGGWTGGGFPGGAGGGDYHIVLTGASFCTIPAPSAAALIGVGGLLALRRRR
jgi:hypothetical protein